VDLAKDNDAKILIRGLRVVADFEYEFQVSEYESSNDAGTRKRFPHP